MIKILFSHLISIFFIFIIFIVCLSKQLKVTSEVIIIGSVHRPTKEYISSVLFEILNQLKPDLILFEADSSRFDENWNFVKLK